MINDKVTSLCQDHEGFVWIGTSAGLQRFDGTRVKNYLADVRDTAALQSDWVSAVFEDSKKRLWVGNDHGAPYLFNKKTGKFYNYNFHTSANNIINGIWRFVEDPRGGLWIAGHTGYYKLNETTNHFERYNERFNIGKNVKTGDLTFDSNNDPWLATTEGVKYFNQSEKKLYDQNHNPSSLPVFKIKEGIANILIDGNYIWLTTGFFRIVYRYNVITRELKPFTFASLNAKDPGPENQKEVVGSIEVLNDGTLIVPLLGRGFAVYNKDIGEFSITNADNTKSYAYHQIASSSGNVCITQDRDGNILMGNESGINICNPTKSIFFNHGKDTDHHSRFPDFPVSDFLEMPNGDIYIGYYFPDGGLIKMNNNYSFIKDYHYAASGENKSSANELWGLFQDSKGIVWAPNQRNGILKFNPLTENLTEETDTILSGPINMIKQDMNPDVIWFAHWSKGLVKEELSTRKKHFYSHFIGSDSNTIKRVQSILIDNDKIWVGTLQNGLQLFDIGKEEFTEAFIPDQKNNTAISSNLVTDILRYSKDTLVVGTEVGLNIFNTSNKTFKAITVREGLPNSFVISVITDAQRNLWVICGGGGLCKINMQDLSVRNYDIDDGIVDNIFNSRFYRLRNGNVLVGTSQGFISFDPSKFKKSPAPSDVIITGLHIFEKELLPDTLLTDHTLTLLYHENSLRIDFASLQFWSPGSITYFYKLDGVDKDWIPAGKMHSAVYNQLRDGQFVFNVKCENRDGVACLHTTQLIIIIKPPFWKTWWFISLLIAIIILITWLLLHRRIQNIRAIGKEKLKVQELTTEKYSIQAQLSKARLEALRSQMNPHFIFNSLNAIQECILTNKIDAAYKYLAEFSKLQRMVLNNSEKELISLTSEMEMLELYLSLESLRFSKSFLYNITAAGISDTDEILIPSLITQPFAENAIWHGLRNKEGDKILSIIYEEKEGNIIITIDDNGIGREMAAKIRQQKIGSSQFASKGTIMMQQRFNVLSQQFKSNIQFETTDKKDKGGLPTGTTVIITFPSNLQMN